VKDFLKVLGNRIKGERKKKGLTQEELAEKTGISNNFVSYIEAGKKTASLKVIKKISDVLEMPLSELFKDIPSSRRKKVDYTTEQIIYLVRDSRPKTKKLLLKLCKTVLQEKN